MQKNTGLLIIDLFSLFDFPQARELAPAAIKAAGKAAQLRSVFDEHGLPVIYANDNFGEWKRDFPQLVAQCRQQPGASAKIARQLAPAPHHYFILKPKHSAFLATPLPVLLAKLGVSRVVLAGMALDSCVLATALDANSREYAPVIASDATAALPGRRKETLRLLQRSAAAQVMSVAAVIRETTRAR